MVGEHVPYKNVLEEFRMIFSFCIFHNLRGKTLEKNKNFPIFRKLGKMEEKRNIFCEFKTV